MKKICFPIVLVGFLALSGITSGESKPWTVPAGNGYDPHASYQGVYEKDRVYRKRAGSELWFGVKKPSKVYTVKCSSAAHSLGTQGTWIGNLREDGSCGSSAEPGEWAVGNYLNFNAAPDSGE
jgi:hypothetical protein